MILCMPNSITLYTKHYYFEEQSSRETWFTWDLLKFFSSIIKEYTFLYITNTISGLIIHHKAYLRFLILTYDSSIAKPLGKPERNLLYQELRNCLDVMEPIDGKPFDEVVRSTAIMTKSPNFVYILKIVSVDPVSF